MILPFFQIEISVVARISAVFSHCFRISVRHANCRTTINLIRFSDTFSQMRADKSVSGGQLFSKADKIVISRGGQNWLAVQAVGYSGLDKSGWTK
jgi:hypothetical protein